VVSRIAWLATDRFDWRLSCWRWRNIRFLLDCGTLYVDGSNVSLGVPSFAGHSPNHGVTSQVECGPYLASLAYYSVWVAATHHSATLAILQFYFNVRCLAH